MAHGISVGIDIGGTFTDVIASGPDGISILKVPQRRPVCGSAIGLRDDFPGRGPSGWASASR